jgi:hypothetical protein
VTREDLRILLALEPSWTISINRKEFLHLRSPEIEVHDTVLRFGKFTRQIVDIEALRPDAIRVRARPRLRSSADILVFYAGERLPGSTELRKRRSAFQNTIASAVAKHFAARVTRKTLYSDKRYGISGAYPRLLLGAGRAVIAVDPDENTPVVNGIIRAAIQWSPLVKRPLTVVAPAARSATLAARLQAMPALRRSFDWLLWDGERLLPLPHRVSPVETFVHPYQKPHVDREVARLTALAPQLLQAVPHIAASAVSVRLRGLEVARVSERETVYPLGAPLEPVIAQLARERRYGSRHPLARAHEEAWLESNLIGQIQDILPVRQDCIYPQVPSFGDKERKIIDLLTITENGRLVVIEVKATADPDLPFQALDYWLAVERHRKAGDFSANGYFKGVTILDAPPLLVLVAPLLSFHRGLDRLLNMLPSTLPLIQIGVNQTWKKGIKVLRRKGPVG